MKKEIVPEKTESSRFPDGMRIMQGRQEYITYIDHSSLRVWPSVSEAHYDIHKHSAIEIILPHRGTATYQLPDQVYHVESGQILFVPTGMTHALTETTDILRYLILFEPSPLYNLQDMPGISAMTEKPIYLTDQSELHTQVSQLLMQVVDCYMKRLPMWNTQCYAYLLQAYALMGRHFLRTAAPKQPAEHQNVDPEIMNIAVNHISEHYMEDLTLEDVAAFAGYSKYYFSRIFKAFFGISFSDYLIVKRLNAAANMLMQTDRPIREIARSSGFGSVASFNRIFREHKQCTPTQFRAIYGTATARSQGNPLAMS